MDENAPSTQSQPRPKPKKSILKKSGDGAGDASKSSTTKGSRLTWGTDIEERKYKTDEETKQVQRTSSVSRNEADWKGKEAKKRQKKRLNKLGDVSFDKGK